MSTASAGISPSRLILDYCVWCRDWHASECHITPANAGASTPFVAAITPRDEGIIDGVGYEGREKPEFVRRDDEGWRHF